LCALGGKPLVRLLAARAVGVALDDDLEPRTLVHELGELADGALGARLERGAPDVEKHLAAQREHDPAIGLARLEVVEVGLQALDFLGERGALRLSRLLRLRACRLGAGLGEDALALLVGAGDLVTRRARERRLAGDQGRALGEVSLVRDALPPAAVARERLGAIENAARLRELLRREAGHLRVGAHLVIGRARLREWIFLSGGRAAGKGNGEHGTENGPCGPGQCGLHRVLSSLLPSLLPWLLPAAALAPSSSRSARRLLVTSAAAACARADSARAEASCASTVAGSASRRASS